MVEGKKSGQSWAALDSGCRTTKGFDYAETDSLRGVAIFVHNARRAFETGMLASLDASACVRKAR
jgi:hypothetical protein